MSKEVTNRLRLRNMCIYDMLVFMNDNLDKCGYNIDFGICIMDALLPPEKAVKMACRKSSSPDDKELCWKCISEYLDSVVK